MRRYLAAVLALLIVQPAHSKSGGKGLSVGPDQGLLVLGTVRTNGVQQLQLRFWPIDSTNEIILQGPVDFEADGGFIGEKPSAVFHALPVKAGRYVLHSTIIHRDGFATYVTTYCPGSFAFEVLPGHSTYLGTAVTDWRHVKLVPGSYAEAEVFALSLPQTPRTVSMAKLEPTRFFMAKKRRVSKECLRPALEEAQQDLTNRRDAAR